MREGASGGGRHWRDNRTLGNRGSFSFYETGMQSETGAKVGRKATQFQAQNGAEVRVMHKYSNSYTLVQSPKRFLMAKLINQVISSHLLVGPLREEDGGVYRCRVDFREAPTRNTRIKLNLISKLKKHSVP